MRKRSELIFNLVLVPLDAIALLSSWVAAFLIRVQYTGKPTVYQVPGHVYLAIFLALAPISVVIFAGLGLYNYGSTRSRWREYSRVLIATAASTMFLIIVDFFSTKPIFPSKAVVIYGLVLTSLSVIGVRFLLNSFQRWLFKYEIGRRQVVVIGKGGVADELTYALQRHRGYRVVAVVGDVAAGVTRLGNILRRHHVDEVLVAQTDMSSKQQIGLIQFTHEQHIAYKFIPSIAGLYQTRSQTALLADLPIIEVVRTPLDGWWRIYKALADYFFAFIGLVVLSPLFLIVAILIKLTDKGPVIYKHERIGRNGKPIKVWKFRTMYSKYSTGSGYEGRTDEAILESLGKGLSEEFRQAQKLKNDPRVTPIGRWLRKTSLDEVPQLMNVLRSEISLIGPRPVTANELERYGNSVSTFLLIKPGMTGLWQVSGRNDISYNERVKLDLYYVENWSAVQDLVILARTVGVVLGRRGY